MSAEGFLGGTVVKKCACQCRRCRRYGFNLRLGRSLGEGNDNPLQYSCLGNPKDRGAWWSTVHGVAKSQTQLSMHAYAHIRGGGEHCDLRKDVKFELHLAC